MSRIYAMSVAFAVQTKEEADAAVEALQQEWTFDDIYIPEVFGPPHDTRVALSGESYLAGGESEEEFAARCYRAVLRVLRRPTEIEVMCTCLEDLPFESYTCDEYDAEDILEELQNG